MSYEGQPEYVRTGFLVDLFEKWIPCLPFDEWGQEVEAMYALARAAVSCSDDDRLPVVVGWILKEFDRAFEDDWWGVNDEDDERAIRRAQDGYEEVVEYWRDRAKGFNGNAPGTERVASDALEEVIEGLPDWVRPNPSAPPLPDPERAEYERLKEKFG